jgi:ABC-type lipoprotein release transport system permease subunit
VSLRETSFGAVLLGIDPVKEREVTTISERLDRGRFLESLSAREVVVGGQLLKNLGADLGDSVVVLSQAYDGTLGNLFFTIVGTMKTGSPELDHNGVFMGLGAAQELLDMDDRVSMLAVSLDKVEEVDDVDEALEGRLEPLGVKCLSWTEIMPELKQSIQLDNITGILMLAVLVVVAAFGILNTMLMSITERFHEFGVLLAVGMPNRKLCAVVFMETVFIVLAGLLAGNLIAAAVNAYLAANPIEITGSLSATYEQYGFIPMMMSTLSAGVFLRPSLIILVVSLVAFIYPGWKVLQLRAMKGIRYT